MKKFILLYKKIAKKTEYDSFQIVKPMGKITVKGATQVKKGCETSG